MKCGHSKVEGCQGNDREKVQVSFKVVGSDGVNVLWKVDGWMGLHHHDCSWMERCKETKRDFPDGPVVRILPVQEAWI